MPASNPGKVPVSGQRNTNTKKKYKRDTLDNRLTGCGHADGQCWVRQTTP